MKKTLAIVGALAMATLSSHATLVLSNSFGYADGPLVTVSSSSPLGEWFTHSGTTGQLDVASGKANLSQVETEDVNTALPGGPYSTGNLYAGFVVNFSATPLTGTGTYFWHFKDDGTANFRARVFATISGAASGRFRVGIANGGNTPVVIATDLDLNTDYKLVVRYDAAAGTATLWINPTSEASVVNRADGSDTATSIGITTVAMRQSNASGGMGVLTMDDLLVGTQFSDVQTVGGPPSISGLIDVSIPASSNTGPLPFLISDVETPAGDLTVSATSDNPTLVPNNPANLTFGGSGENRTLTVTPAAGQQGTAGIEVVVTDGNSETATNSFTITVGSPSISSIPNQIAATNTVAGPVAFTVNDNETAPGSLTVTATSSNPGVIPDSNIGIQNLGGGNRSITLTNVGAGLATITVTVSDGTFNISTDFTLTAYPLVGVVLDESFAYPDGSVITNSSFFWNAHSGTTGQTQVASEKLQLSTAQSEDINAFLTGFPYADSGGFVFFARFIVDFSALPTASGVGEYFAHFKEFGNSQFRARIFATTNGAAPGTYRIAIANGGFSTTVFPADLALNTPQVIISRYNVATGESALWVNPINEGSPSVVATDSTTPPTIYSYAFRQSSGIGILTVDDLKIATSFNEVAVALAPTITSISIVGQDVQIDFTGSAAVSSYELHKSGAVGSGYALDGTANFSDLGGGNFRVTTALSGSQQYYRIRQQ